MYYHHIITKLSATITEFNHIAIVNKFKDLFDIPEQVTATPDGQINHLLAITMSLVKHVPDSPYLEEIFNNFLQDYMHYVNPNLPAFVGDLYLSQDYKPVIALKQPLVRQRNLVYA